MDDFVFSDNDSGYQLPGDYVPNLSEPPPTYTPVDTSGGDNDSNYITPGPATNVDATTPGGASGPGLITGVRTGSAETGYQTLNPDGSITYQDPDGSVYTRTPTGNYITDSGGTKWEYNPTTGAFTSLGASAPDSGISSLVNSVKNFFKKPDGSYDLAKIAGFGTAAAGILGAGKSTGGGWQGTIPTYTASREQIKYDDTNRRPGSAGRQYFTDVNYSGASTVPQAQGILAAYQAAQPTTPPTANKPAVALPAKPITAAPARAIPDYPVKEINGPGPRDFEPSKVFDPSLMALAGNPADVFKQTQAYQDFLKSQEGKMNTMDMYESPHFGTQTSGSYGRALDDAYNNWVQQNSVAPVVKAATGRYLQGPTDGMADEINTSIDDKQPAKLSHGEFVVPADVVSHLGNGNSDAGAKKLYSMMDKVRQARTGTKKQGKQINPDKYMPGGTVNKYAKGGIAELPVKKFAGTTGSYVPATDTTTSSTLSPWAGDYVAGMLGKGQALANAPYQTYTGPLTAGPSALQEQAFAGASNLASTGYDPTAFTAGTFGTQQAQQYMNPYLQAALDPQLSELRRQSQINLQPSMAKLTQAGGYGGGRQAIMESEAARNLLTKQNEVVGQGYATAYDKAMQQFNADQARQMEAQKASEASRQYGADYGLKSLQELERAGATERGITAEGIAADKAQFEEQRDYPYKMVQYQQGLLQGLPIATQSNTQNMSPLTSLLANLGYGGQLYDLLNNFGKPKTTTTTSPGTTNTTSAGTTQS